MERVAVVGGGIFGVTATAHLATEGYDVTLFERADRLFQGTTGNNTNRVHVGAHYPRDLETALQSNFSARDFSATHQNAVFNNFENYYAISLEDSKTSADDFEQFLVRDLKIQTSACKPSVLGAAGLDFDRLGGIWRVEEGVILPQDLMKELEGVLYREAAKIRLNSTVTRLQKTASGWSLWVDEQEWEYDFVVLTTYGRPIEHTNNKTCGCNSAKRFQVTLTLEVDSSFPVFGLTIMDGDFLTALPGPNRGTFSIYAPGPSVLSEVVSASEVPDLENLDPAKIDQGEEAIIERLKFWLPEFPFQSVVKRKLAVRSLVSGSEPTDARPSKLIRHDSGLIEVWSGKLDHAISIVKLLPEQLSQSIVVS